MSKDAEHNAAPENYFDDGIFDPAPDYRTASDETRRAADEIISQIDLSDFHAASNIFSRIYDEGDKIFDKMNRSFATARLYGSDIADIQNAFSESEGEQLQEKTERYIKGKSIDPEKDDTNTLKGKFFNSALGAALSSAGVKSAQESRRIKKIKDEAIADDSMKEFVSDLSLKLRKVRALLNETDHKLAYDIQALEELAKAHADVHRKLSLHLCAVKELQQRFMDDEMPALQKKPDQDKLQKIDFINDILDALEASYMQMAERRVSLRDMHNYCKERREDIRMYIDYSLPHWTLMSRQINLMLSISKIEEMRIEAEEFYKKKLAREEMQDRKFGDGSPAHDPKKYGEMMQKRAEQTEILADHLENLGRQKEDALKKLSEITDEIFRIKTESLNMRAEAFVKKSQTRSAPKP